MLSNPNYNLNLSTLRESTQPKLSGELLSHSTHSQYSFGDAGKSACTLIAAMAAADLLAITSLEEASRIFCEERLNDWVSSGIHLYDRIAGGLQRGNEHTALDDIWDHDALQMTVRRLERGIPIQRISRASSFLSAIGEARSWLRNCTMKPDQNAVYSLALVITKPPETVLLVFEAGCGSSVLFDSHPRTTQRGIGGSHAIRFSTDDEAASNLSFLFPSTSGLEDCGYGAQMMNQFEAIPLRQTNYNASASKLDSNYSASSLSARKEVYDDGSFAALQAALQQARDELEASEEKCVVLADRNAELEAKVAATQGQLEVLQGIMGESRAAADGMQRRISQAEVGEALLMCFVR